MISCWCAYSNGRYYHDNQWFSPISHYCFHVMAFRIITFPQGDWHLWLYRKHAVPPPTLPALPHPVYPTLGEKYKASLVWEHRDLSDTALYHGILPLSHTHTQHSSRGGSFSPLTFSEALGPWHDTQTRHCTERPISPKVHVNMQTPHGDKTQ